MAKEQISCYFEGHNQSTTVDIIEFMTDSNHRFNVLPYIMSRNDIEIICRFLVESVALNFVVSIGSPLYLCSRILNVFFPMTFVVMMWNMGCLDRLTASSLLWIGLYSLSIMVLGMKWMNHLWNGSDVWSLIWGLCPSHCRPGEMYISRKYGERTQKQLFAEIKWYYFNHRHAELRGKLVTEVFGADITHEIFDFLPKTYAQAKEVDEKLKQC